MAQRYFATINPGLEEALLAEVRELGGKRATQITGGVEFDATNTVFYQAAYELRCTNRLWLRIDEFRARDAPELYNKTQRLEWARVVRRETPVEVRAVCHKSALSHSDRVEKAVSDGIDASLGREPVQGKKPALTVLARIVENRCELSLDASGELHYRRGWKTEAVAAPLRESVAAAVLRTIGWTPDDALIDPYCGSGTFVIEAAQRVLGVSAGTERDFDLQRWSNFRPDLWEEVEATARARQRTQTDVLLRGTDIDPKAVDAARHNAAAAHVEGSCSFDVADVANLEPPPSTTPGWIVCNPPWNLRLADPAHAGLGALVAGFGERFAGWRLAVLAPRRWHPSGGKAQAKFELGGVPVTLWVFDRR